LLFSCFAGVVVNVTGVVAFVAAVGTAISVISVFAAAVVDVTVVVAVVGTAISVISVFAAAVVYVTVVVAAVVVTVVVATDTVCLVFSRIGNSRSQHYSMLI